MKRNVIFIISILIFAIMACGCAKGENQNENRKQKVGFLEKFSMIKKDSDWYYYFIISYNDDGSTSNFFNGINLKYSTLDDYFVYIRDSKTNNIIEKVPSFPILATSEKTVNGIMERDEVTTINNYFNSKQFDDKISIDDLEDLSLNNFQIDDILLLYNNALDYEIPQYFGNFRFPEYSVDKGELINGKQWQVGQLNNYGYIKAINIELLYEDGTYLSDVVKNNRASESQVELYNSINLVEDYIITNQSLNISGLMNDEILEKELMSLFNNIGKTEK